MIVLILTLDVERRASLGSAFLILALSTIWYRVYVRPRAPNRAAVYGLFRRLGEQHDQGVEEERWSILQERGAHETDSFDELV